MIFGGIKWKRMDIYGRAKCARMETNLNGKYLLAFQQTLKHCFERNFIKDNVQALTIDPRWAVGVKVQENIIVGGEARIEIPPQFVDGQPEIPPGYDKPIAACISVPRRFVKRIQIKLADEGLTDDIMDNFRPTIVVTEMAGNRRDCTLEYIMFCSLDVNSESNVLFQLYNIPNKNQREFRDEHRDENGQWIRVAMGLRFKQSEDEGWHQLEYSFKDYPAGMRYVTLFCGGFGTDQNPEGCYGLKLVNCSVKALCEKNAPE